MRDRDEELSALANTVRAKWLNEQVLHVASRRDAGPNTALCPCCDGAGRIHLTTNAPDDRRAA